MRTNIVMVQQMLCWVVGKASYTYYVCIHEQSSCPYDFLDNVVFKMKK